MKREGENQKREPDGTHIQWEQFYESSWPIMAYDVNFEVCPHPSQWCPDSSFSSILSSNWLYAYRIKYQIIIFRSSVIHQLINCWFLKPITNFPCARQISFPSPFLIHTSQLKLPSSSFLLYSPLFFQALFRAWIGKLLIYLSCSWFIVSDWNRVQRR